MFGQLCTRNRERMAVVTLAASLALTLTGCDSSRPGANASLSPAHGAHRAIANARRQGWVHVEARFEMSGRTIAFSQDAGPRSGRQAITIGSEHATVRLVDRLVYVYADAGALRDYVGLAPGSAAAGAGKWISIRRSDPLCATVAAGVTLSDTLAQISLEPPLRHTARSTVNGRAVIGIRGEVPTARGDVEPGTLYIPASGDVLPVASDFTDPGATDRAVFSAWGTAVTIRAPAHAVPWTAIASAPAQARRRQSAKRRNSVI
jgi:hypothetical protein